MNDRWLEEGHGALSSHLAVVFSSEQRRGHADPVAARSNSEVPPEHVTSRWLARTSRLAVATVVWCGIPLGAAATAWAVQDVLFPSVGRAAASVWSNPGRDAERPTGVVALSPDSRAEANNSGDSDADSTTSTPTPPNSSDEPRADTNGAVSVAAGSETPNGATTTSVDDSGADDSGADDSGANRSGSDSGSDSDADADSGSSPGSDNSGSDSPPADSGSSNSSSGSGDSDPAAAGPDDSSGGARTDSSGHGGGGSGGHGGAGG